MTKFRNSLFATALLMAAVESNASTGGFANNVGATETPPVPAGNFLKSSYFFKTEKIKVKDEISGETTIADGRKHPTVEVNLPVPTLEEIFGYLGSINEKEGEGDNAKPTVAAKVGQMLLDQIHDLIYQAGRGQINAWLEEETTKNPNAEFKVDNFDFSKLTLETIALQEPGQRGAWAPSEDELKAFNEDYANIFINEVKYDPKKVAKHCELWSKGMVKAKNDKNAVAKLKEFLTIWASKTGNMEEYAKIYGWLVGKADKYLKAEEKNFSEAL